MTNKPEIIITEERPKTVNRFTFNNKFFNKEDKNNKKFAWG